MKKFAFLLVAAFTMAWGASASPLAFPNLQLNYIRPERFTDFRLQGRPESESGRIFSDGVSPALSRELGRRLPGTRLILTFTDIDLAGRYEPWRGPRFFDVRFYRDSTPLRLEFQYTLTGARETVIASGTARVYEAYYQYQYEVEGNRAEKSSNPAYYEVQALQHWLDRLIKQTRAGQRRTVTGVPTRAAS